MTIPAKGDQNLAGVLPTVQVSSGYKATLQQGKDLNSTLIYTIGNGKTAEQ